MRYRFWSGAVTGVAVAILAGCATAGAGGERRDQNRLTAEEIASIDAMSLYDVVQRLRPRWLEIRSQRSFGMGPGTTVVVFLDRTHIGLVEELRRFGKDEAAWLQYMAGSEAAARLPGVQQANVEGAIIIHTRPPDSD